MRKMIIFAISLYKSVAIRSPQIMDNIGWHVPKCLIMNL